MPEVRDLTSRRPKDANPDTLLPASRCLKAYRLFQSANLKDFFGLSLHRTGTESRKWRIPCAKSPTAQRPGRHFPPIRTENGPPLYGTARRGHLVQKWASLCTKQLREPDLYRNGRLLVQTHNQRDAWYRRRDSPVQNSPATTPTDRKRHSRHQAFQTNHLPSSLSTIHKADHLRQTTDQSLHSRPIEGKVHPPHIG